MALKVCTTTGCPTLTSGGRCGDHKRQANLARGTAAEQGYGPAHRAFRAIVLQRDPTCTMPGCNQPSTDADHWPIDRRDLVAQGLDPNNPDHGRGLCSLHHKQETARLQPGGWNDPDRA